jgi:hypothetical protein
VPLDFKALVGEATSPWKIIAERRVQEWVDAGGPDRLSNKGQKLDLSENPFEPYELRLAYKVLKNADFAPDWIEIGKEIEVARMRGAPAAEINRLIERFNRACPIAALHRVKLGGS